MGKTCDHVIGLEECWGTEGFTYVNNDSDFNEEEITIWFNYCPMCGVKLAENKMQQL